MCIRDRSNVLELIKHEIDIQNQSGNGFILIKVNSMNDMDIMNALIKASQSGVKIRLIIRGICCLRPGIKGFTDNITVKSIIGRYLEHSRIFVFGSGERARMFIGSGDLLARNTTRRIEVFTEVKTYNVRKQLNIILKEIENDNVNGWYMRPDGDYERCSSDGSLTDSHSTLYKKLMPVKSEITEKRRLSRIMNIFTKNQK